jgi:hypothetical protein
MNNGKFIQLHPALIIILKQGLHTCGAAAPNVSQLRTANDIVEKPQQESRQVCHLQASMADRPCSVQHIVQSMCAWHDTAPGTHRRTSTSGVSRLHHMCACRPGAAIQDFRSMGFWVRGFGGSTWGTRRAMVLSTTRSRPKTAWYRRLDDTPMKRPHVSAVMPSGGISSCRPSPGAYRRLWCSRQCQWQAS